MTEEVWCNEILKITSRLDDRKQAAILLLQQPQLLEYTLDFLRKTSDRELITKSAYAIDQALRMNIVVLIPYKMLFFEALRKLQRDTEKRIFAKIIELISGAHLENKFPLHPGERKLLIEQAFEWLINDEKVAVKVFAMQCLYNLRNAQNSIIPELTAQLEQQFSEAGPAFQSRARHILKKLKN